ncbi:hypothetical protein BN8_00619 [Fibrisoma limi BUZ 3]|uniref:Uncharacterized protein n=1 Tax=Fibrisoma limi BUZ 3 TaxID=1185876 RepID=I2GCQ3_9BACT|nr:hypothetical protein BN8_00619 [Fibrisoma limi BUZ 3]
MPVLADQNQLPVVRNGHYVQLIRIFENKIIGNIAAFGHPHGIFPHREPRQPVNVFRMLNLKRCRIIGQ